MVFLLEGLDLLFCWDAGWWWWCDFEGFELSKLAVYWVWEVAGLFLDVLEDWTKEVLALFLFFVLVDVV